MANLGQKVIILAGIKGNIYATQGTYVTKFAQIPYYLTNTTNSLVSNLITWGGISTRTGSVVFGCTMTLNSAAGGIYILYEDGRIVQDNTPYTGAANVTAIYATQDVGYYIGYSGGIDTASGTKPSAGTYKAVYQTKLIPLGNKTQKGSISEIEIQTNRAQGGNIRVGYRYDLSSSFTTLATFTTAETSYNADAGLTDLENIQFQYEFDDDQEITELRFYK